MDLVNLAERVRKIGWTTIDSGIAPDQWINDNGFLVVRGTIVDGIFLNDRYGRSAVKTWHDKLNKKLKKLRANN
jgi:hypothetical protein